MVLLEMILVTVHSRFFADLQEKMDSEGIEEKIGDGEGECELYWRASIA